MEIAGYILFTLVGICLGLIGSGGSILTVPILVYIFHLSPVLATSYSLLIVGVTSLTGAIINYIKGNTRLSLALPLGIISPATVFVVRRYVMPTVPEHFVIGGINISRSFVIMFLFALLMIGSAVSMLQKVSVTVSEKEIKGGKQYFALAIFGVIIGCITGFLGSGGGFLIVPALVILLKVPMREAVGTSLLIIAVNSLIGFAGDIGHYYFDVRFLTIVTILSVGGILVGNKISNRFSADGLKTGFGWFVLIMGSYIIVREVFL